MTLLPNKHLPTNRTLVGLGAMLLAHLETASTVSGLWEVVMHKQEVGSFSNFILTLDYLYAIGAIDYEPRIADKGEEMIVAIRCNMSSFQEVEFDQGFNVILADRTQESTRLDSRNGLGKTTLVEIIHFCLGSRTRRNQGLMVTQLNGWSFSLEMRIDGREFVVTRNTDNASRIKLDGDIRDLTGPSVHLDGTMEVSISDWNSILGDLLFGLSIQDPAPKYQTYV